MEATGFRVKIYIYISDEFKNIFSKKQQFPQSPESIQKISSEYMTAILW